MGYGCRTFGGDGRGAPHDGTPPTPPLLAAPRGRGGKTTVSGSLIQDTVWSTNTVKVMGSVTVENGITLTILPGVKVEFQDYYSLTVKGRLLASGTPSDRIVFTTDEPNLFTPDGSHGGCWNGIRFPGTRETNGGSLLEYCILEYSKDTALEAEDPPGCGGALRVYDFSKLAVRNCIFRHNAFFPSILTTTCFPVAMISFSS